MELAAREKNEATRPSWTTRTMRRWRRTRKADTSGWTVSRTALHGAYKASTAQTTREHGTSTQANWSVHCTGLTRT